VIVILKQAEFLTKLRLLISRKQELMKAFKLILLFLFLFIYCSCQPTEIKKKSALEATKNAVQLEEKSIERMKEVVEAYNPNRLLLNKPVALDTVRYAVRRFYDRYDDATIVRGNIRNLMLGLLQIEGLTGIPIDDLDYAYFFAKIDKTLATEHVKRNLVSSIGEVRNKFTIIAHAIKRTSAGYELLPEPKDKSYYVTYDLGHLCPPNVCPHYLTETYGIETY